MSKGVHRFTALRAWQTADIYKKAVYRLCSESALASDRDRRAQLEKSVAGPPANIAEGFGRFNPIDSARFAVIARASLMESQNHLRDAVDKGYIAEQTRLELEQLVQAALGEVSGWMEYLYSDEAMENVRRIRARRQARRRPKSTPEHRTD